ncbi:MAG: glycoside hydrolase family 20 zincin-like fold domain-containing protein [Bryobacteraceae bacterium]
MFYFLIFLIVWIPRGTAEVRFPHGKPVHVAASPQSDLERRTLSSLTAYARAVTGVDAKVGTSTPRGTPAIRLVRNRSDSNQTEKYRLSTDARAVTVEAGTERGLRRGVQRIIIRSRQENGDLVIPDVNETRSPWIPERQWALCPWTPRDVRGAFVNPWADNRMNLFLFSDDALERYVEMFDWFGFSGVQLLETSYNYGVFGSPEAFQDKERAIARKAKKFGQNVSLWVWAAEFNGFGWTDPEVTYTPTAGRSAFDDPEVRRSFEKYYDQYARLAPDVDLLIGHFYDPGRLKNRQDVFRYMRLLEQKFKAGNPKVRMAIDSWGTGHSYLRELMDNGFSDYLLLEMSMPSFFKPGQRESFHEEAKKLGLKVGVWGWYTTEYETDQLASMYVNAKVLSHFYRQMRDGAASIQPVTYWSEMEAHHLNNIYSMYAAGQLLWDPDRDPHQILEELTTGIWGRVAGGKVLDAVELIQDVRSGDTWNTYWWTLPTHRMGTQDPTRDRDRAAAAVAALSGLRPDPGFVPKIPLPCSPGVLLDLMLPHLRQIRAYAEFRIDLDRLRAQWNAGMAKDELARGLAAIWKPIPEYDTWVGTFGLPENRHQERQVRKLAADAGVSVAVPGWVRFRDADRKAQSLQNRQGRQSEEYRFRADQLREFFWPPEKQRDTVDLLLQMGVIEKVDGGFLRLANWEAYRAK